MGNGFYKWIMDKAARPSAERWLAVFGVAESSVFPLPVDIMLAPMVLARPERARALALNVILATMTGAMIGYLIGWMFMESLGAWLVALWGYGDKLVAFQTDFQENGLLILLFVGLTPIPYKLAAIASGALALDPLFFLLATALAKGPRYGLQVWLLARYGEPVRRFTEAHMPLVLGAVGLLLLLPLLAQS